MTYVKNVAEIRVNAIRLLDAIHKNTAERAHALELVKISRVFLPIYYNAKLTFVPSKFIGYENNQLTLHIAQRNSRDGRDTNREIDKILGKHGHDPELERRLHSYRAAIGISLQNYKHSFWPIDTKQSNKPSENSGIEDFDQSEIGNESPEYRIRTSGSYIRDDRVRRSVLKRANGLCEYKGCQPFIGRKGKPYLEAHHVISLCAEGVDKPENVIALCANHHREAHFGEEFAALNDSFLNILRGMNN